MITNVTPIEVLGTAFGNAYAFKNFYSCLVPFIVGAMMQNYEEAINRTLLFFLGMATVSIALNVVMWTFDCRSGALKKKELSGKVMKKLRRTTTYGIDLP